MIPTNVTYHIVICGDGEPIVLDYEPFGQYDARPFVKCKGGYLKVEVTNGVQTTLIGMADIDRSWVPPHADPDAVTVAEDIVVKNVADGSVLCTFQPDKKGWFLLLKDKQRILQAIAVVPWVAEIMHREKLERIEDLIHRVSSIKEIATNALYDLQNDNGDPDIIWQSLISDIYKKF
jgi:hypothetical protein